MQKNIILCLLIASMAVFYQPVFGQAADKNVLDCLDGDNEDCLEETDENLKEETNEIPEPLVDEENMNTGSFALNIVKMIFALLLILALIYGLLWFLKKRRSYEQVGALENIGGISVGTNKSVQIVRIGSSMYLLGVGENVELLKELSAEEAEQVQLDKSQSPSVPAASFLQGMLRKKGTKEGQQSGNIERDFQASFQKELDKLKENRHQLMDNYKKKDDRDV